MQSARNNCGAIVLPNNVAVAYLRRSNRPYILVSESAVSVYWAYCGLLKSILDSSNFLCCSTTNSCSASSKLCGVQLIWFKNCLFCLESSYRLLTVRFHWILEFYLANLASVLYRPVLLGSNPLTAARIGETRGIWPGLCCRYKNNRRWITHNSGQSCHCHNWHQHLRR